MNCPYCENEESKVVDSRDAQDGIRRRRECLLCSLRFTTYEKIHSQLLNVVKKDNTKEAFSLEKQNASLSLLYFGYSYCPDICPYDLERNAYVKDIMDEQKIDINLVFITLDPSRDTTERLKDFSEYIHKSMIALTGSNDQIEALKKAYGVFGKSNKVDYQDQSYLVDHSTFSYLDNKKGEVLSYFNRRESPEKISEKIKCFN